jgi:hypothetical protein
MGSGPSSERPSEVDPSQQSSASKVTLSEMAALVDADLLDAVSLKIAREKWGWPNSAAENRVIAVRRALLDTINLVASYPSVVREALKSAKERRELPPSG